jgi:serine protease Do
MKSQEKKTMKTWFESCKAAATRRLTVALLAIVAVGSVATFNFAKSAKAAAAPAPAAAPLDDNSVAALLTLDRAMETLAARVTPAVVNVTVASKANPQHGENEGMPDSSTCHRSRRTVWNTAWAAA